MHATHGALTALLAQGLLESWIANVWGFLKVLVGFSIIIFVHELGHFLAAKWVGIRVDRFAVGFGYRLFGWRRGEGFTFGRRPDYSPEQLRERGFGETDYCFKALPVGGYVRMLGQDDIVIDDKTNEIRLGNDPRAFTSRPVGHRMIVVSAGVVFNLLFAALLLTGIFLIGQKVEAPVVHVPPDSAAAGLLHSGDRVLAINGKRVASFRDVLMTPIFSEGPVRLRIERDGVELPDEVVVDTFEDPRFKIARLPVEPFITTTVSADWKPVRVARAAAPPGATLGPGADDAAFVELPSLRVGDTVVRVDDREVHSALDVIDAFRLSGGALLKLTVERRDPQRPAADPVLVDCFQRATLTLLPATPGAARPATPSDKDLLGFVRRVRILRTESGPAQSAGLREGDVVVEWNTIANPTHAEIMDSIAQSAGRPLRVFVERDGQRVGPLIVTPRRPFSLFGQPRPKIGVVLDDFFDDDRPVVANVASGSPAAALHLPRGSLLLSIDGRAVPSWYDVVDALSDAAGHEVRVRYRSGENEAEGLLRVPSSLVNELDLPRSAVVVTLNGQRTVRLRQDDGRTVEAGFTLNPYAIRKFLEQHVGETVRVGYSLTASGAVREKPFAVRADNVDPWQMRILFAPGSGFEMLSETLHAHGNPLRALGMGVQEVGYWINHVYLSLHMLLVKRNVGVEQVSGPVAIFGAAIERARLGLGELMYFLAFISVNLAVLNFLPMPVMDGGLMVFLIIEKIKGKPLSIRTQMVTTLVGLAAILLIGILVTINDIGQLFS